MRKLSMLPLALAASVAHTPTILAAPAIVHMSDYAYANTLTGLLGALYDGLDVVSRELVGFIPSATRNSAAERAAVNQDVTYPIAPPAVSFDIAPAMATPEPPDTVMGLGTIRITKSKAVPFGIVGEEQRALNNGAGWRPIQADWFAQALRAITNEIESDGGLAAYLGGSRAYGTPGTTPFAPGTQQSIGDSAQLQKILDDNGAPGERSLVIDTTAAANLGSHPNLTRVNEAGTSMTLRQGELLDQHGFSIKKSAGVKNHVKGTAAAATTNASGYAVGAQTITLASAGTGTIKAGDVITFAGDANKYVVASGDTSTADGGTITIQEPGLRVAIPASATAITVLNSYTANVGFSRSALHLVLRAPAAPAEGDNRLDSIMLYDERSGLYFELSIWPGYRKVRYEVAAAWGWKAVAPRHIAILQG